MGLLKVGNTVAKSFFFDINLRWGDLTHKDRKTCSYVQNRIHKRPFGVPRGVKAFQILELEAIDHFGGFVLSGNTCSRNWKLGQTWRSVIEMLFKIHNCFGHLIDKFARFRHETVVKMENMSREEKFKAMKLSELKAYLQNREITANSFFIPGLVAIACAVEEMSLPLLFQVSEDPRPVKSKPSFESSRYSAA